MTEPLRFAVLGDPVLHSKSPRMHTAAYRSLGLPHSYEAIRADEGELARYVDALRQGTFAGLNVTVPHKRRILEHVDVVDASADACGAANTLVRRDDGCVVAHNTDAPALAAEIALLAPELRTTSRAHALVLGAGGAARAAIRAFAADLRVARISVRARAYDRAELSKIERVAQGVELAFEPWAPRPATEREVHVVVQATSVGMEGAAPGEIVADVVAFDALPKNAALLDVVYAPPETPFLARARAHHLRSANGLGMLARQGALAFTLWLGLPAPYDVMRAALDNA